MTEDQMGNSAIEESSENEVKPSAEIKEEYLKRREEEIRQYYQELDLFLQARNIALGAELVDGDNGKKFNVFIIDRQ